MPKVAFHPNLGSDLLEAVAWLDEQLGYLDPGNHLIDVFSEATNHVGQFPTIYRKVYKEFRHMVLHPFKHLLYYRIDGETIVIVLLIHGAQDPEYIRKQLDSR